MTRTTHSHPPDVFPKMDGGLIHRALARGGVEVFVGVDYENNTNRPTAVHFNTYSDLPSEELLGKVLANWDEDDQLAGPDALELPGDGVARTTVKVSDPRGPEAEGEYLTADFGEGEVSHVRPARAAMDATGVAVFTVGPIFGVGQYALVVRHEGCKAGTAVIPVTTT